MLQVTIDGVIEAPLGSFTWNLNGGDNTGILVSSGGAFFAPLGVRINSFISAGNGYALQVNTGGRVVLDSPSPGGVAFAHFHSSTTPCGLLVTTHSTALPFLLVRHASFARFFYSIYFVVA